VFKEMKLDKYPIPTTCPYCNSKVICTSNAEIYGKEYGNGRCYKCTSCDAYVGVHDGTNIPLGRLANKQLRELKKKFIHNLILYGKRTRISNVQNYMNN
jgi:DNA-directed RNA polymerase subunit RPC12/RpoP